MAHCGVQWPNVRFIGFEANEWLNDNDRMIAFIGGAQIDPFGNVNSTCIGDYHNPITRFTGSGGANGIATYSNTVIMMQHENDALSIKSTTSPAPDGETAPADVKLGLPGNRGPIAVVTDRGILKFDDKTKRMYLAGYYPTSSPKTYWKIPVLTSMFPKLFCLRRRAKMLLR